MMNIMRADLYRIFRGKGIYITLAIFVILIVLRIFANGTIGIGTAIVDADGNAYESVGDLVSDDSGDLAPIIGGGVSVADEIQPVTGAESIIMAMADAGSFLYYLLPLIVFIASTDFAYGGVKNILASGTSRTKYFLSKLVLSCIFCAVLYLFNIAVSTVVATIANGFGTTPGAEYVLGILKPLGLQLMLCIAAICVGIFITFAMKSTGALIGIYVAWLFIPLLLIFILIDIREGFSDLLYYDITVNIQALANIDMMTSTDIARTFAIAGFYIIASIFGGIALFRRSEIK